jgi:hypothetical protein
VRDRGRIDKSLLGFQGDVSIGAPYDEGSPRESTMSFSSYHVVVVCTHEASGNAATLREQRPKGHAKPPSGNRTTCNESRWISWDDSVE